MCLRVTFNDLQRALFIVHRPERATFLLYSSVYTYNIRNCPLLLILSFKVRAGPCGDCVCVARMLEEEVGIRTRILAPI